MARIYHDHRQSIASRNGFHRCALARLFQQMRSKAMKSLMLAGAMTLAMGTVCFAEGLYWVVGNRATNKCDIVTSNPVVVGDIWFQDGPYKSLADAKLARSTIGACPEKDPSAD
jgi:hypothetical protein